MSKAKVSIEQIRHSLSHLLAAAVLQEFPDAKLGIGPVIDDGFYYDILLSNKISDSDLTHLEKNIKHLIKQNLPFTKETLTPATARKLFSNQPFKLELIDELKKAKQAITIFKTGDIFTDLCSGPHVTNTKDISLDAFKLHKIAGAYWRSNANNQMLTRIYGLAFNSKQELDNKLEQIKNAAARDHRKLGQELDLFTFSELVGAGLPLFTPKGTVIRNQLQQALLDISARYDVTPVIIPHLAKRELYETSGHAAKFGDELFVVKSHYNQEFILKPVNCPHHTQIYASRPRSYRDLPIRYIESTMQYRDEKPGEIGGLTRVRAITVDDGHTFCTVDQIKEETTSIAKIIEEFYTRLGLWEDHWVSLSVRDPKTPDQYIGDEADWNKAEKMLASVARDLKLKAKRIEGEAALYGPKLDYMFRDALGNERQLATIQIDFAMPKRFGLTYTDKTGQDKTPVMLHRAILGSYERFLAILIEHFAGAFPLWLSPVQVRLLTISDKHQKYASEIVIKLKISGFRVELDDSGDTIGKKIRNAETQKIPYMVIIGDTEQKAKTISLRRYGQGDKGIKTLSAFIKLLTKELKLYK